MPELYVQGLSFFFFFVGRIVYVHVCQVTSVLIHREKHKSPGRELKLKCLDQSWARSRTRKHMSLCLNPFYVQQVEAGQISSDPPLHAEPPCSRSARHFRSGFNFSRTPALSKDNSPLQQSLWGHVNQWQAAEKLCTAELRGVSPPCSRSPRHRVRTDMESRQSVAESEVRLETADTPGVKESMKRSTYLF